MVTKEPRTAAAAEEGSENDEVQRVIEQLHELQGHLDKINEKAIEEMIEVDKKYNKIKNPVYARRDEIISCIQDFWLSVFLNHPVLENRLTEYDQKILEYLDCLSVEDFPDPRKGYCITFTFKPNLYFKNRKLTKTIKFSDDGSLRSVGTTIMWKPSKGPNGERNNVRSRSKRPRLSLFKWISDTLVDVNQDTVAEIIKEDIWPNPIELLDHAEDECEDDEDNEDDEEDNDDDDNGKDDDGSGGDMPCIKDGIEAEDNI